LLKYNLSTLFQAGYFMVNDEFVNEQCDKLISFQV
jgi:hypothetical protein